MIRVSEEKELGVPQEVRVQGYECPPCGQEGCMVSRELAAFIVARHVPVILNNPSDAVPFQHVASSAPSCTGESRRKEIVWPRVSGTCDTSFLQSGWRSQVLRHCGDQNSDKSEGDEYP